MSVKCQNEYVLISIDTADELFNRYDVFKLIESNIVINADIIIDNIKDKEAFIQFGGKFEEVTYDIRESSNSSDINELQNLIKDSPINVYEDDDYSKYERVKTIAKLPAGLHITINKNAQSIYSFKNNDIVISGLLKDVKYKFNKSIIVYPTTLGKTIFGYLEKKPNDSIDSCLRMILRVKRDYEIKF